MFINDFYFFQFEVFFICFIVISLLFYTYLSGKNFETLENKKRNYLVSKISKPVFSFGIFILCILAWNTPSESYYLFNEYYQNTPLTSSLRLIICLLFFVFLLSIELTLEFEFWVLIMLSIFASIAILNANDLISFFFSIELQSLSLYILVATRQTSSFSTEAALKYFTIGSFSSAVMLLGVALMYGVCGLTSFNDLRLFIPYYKLLGEYSIIFILGFTLFLVGILFKLGAAPFHIWIPDVYSGTSWLILSYIATLPKLAIFLVSAKLYYLIFLSLSIFYQPIFQVSALLCIIIGSLSAIYQVKLKRFIAYSSITNSAYMLILFSMSDISSICNFFFYSLTYVTIMLGIFVIFNNLRNWSNNSSLIRLNALANLYEINSPLAFSILVLIFSLAGIPPFWGFFSKMIVFYSLVVNNNILIAILLAIWAVISTYYYLRLVKLIFFNRNNWTFFSPISYSSALIISFITLLNIIFVFDPSFLFNLIKILGYYLLLW